MTLLCCFVLFPLYCVNVVQKITHDKDYEANRPYDDEGSCLENIQERLEDISIVCKMTALFLIKMILFPLLLGAVIRLSALGLFETGESRYSLTYFVSTIAESPVITGLALQWVVGIAFMLLVTVIVLELREVLHPDVFDGIIRVPDDQHLLLTLIEDSLFHHARRIVMSTLVYGTLIVAVCFTPTYILQYFFRTSLYASVFPIPFPTCYVWTTGQVAAEVAVAHIIVLQTVNPLKSFLYNTLGDSVGFFCGIYGLREYLMPIAAAIQPPNVESTTNVTEDGADGETKEEVVNTAPLTPAAAATSTTAETSPIVEQPRVPEELGGFVRGAPLRQPWQPWQAPDDKDENGHRYGYREDPLTGESTRVLLAERVKPFCSSLRVVCLIGTCWLLLLSLIAIGMVIIQVLIHVPVWTFSLPQFMFHAPVTFLLVVYCGMCCRSSLNRHLNPPNNDEDENENEDEDENENENENNENVENDANNEEADREVGINNETKKNKQNNTSLGDNISFTAMFTCVGVLVVAWAWAAVMLGAGISRYSLRLQQMHARTQEQQEDILPVSFFSGLFNMRHFICGIWLLDLFFCLHSNGLSTMHGWSRMFDEAKETMVAPRPDASDRSEKSLLLIWKGFMKSLGVMAFKVGSVGTMLLTFLEIDRMAEYSGDIVWYGTCIPVAYCLLGVLQVVYSWRTQVRVSMVSFHNRLRDTKYGSGSQLQNRPANK
jgi:hypothetical protein